jgi:Flp pilus assembly protein TadB
MSESSQSFELGPETPELKPIDPTAPLIPRSQAPEKTADLTALRDLANQTARSAITRSVQVQTRDIQLKGVFNFACAAGAIVCGVACYFFLPGMIRFVAVAMTLIVAAVYGREGTQLLIEANERGRTTQNKPAEAAQKADKKEKDLESNSDLT